MSGLWVADGGAVVISGSMLTTLRQVVLIAARTRQRSGLPLSAHHHALLDAVATATGQPDTTSGHDRDPWVHEAPTVTVAEAASRLGVSERTARRMAPRLGGRRIGGRWLLDTQAITEHLEGVNK